MPSTITILSAVVSAAAMVVAGWMSGRATRRVAAIEGATPAYSALDGRVKGLDERVTQLEIERDIDRAHIIDVHGWDDYGRPGDMPPAPPWFRARWAPPRREDTQG